MTRRRKLFVAITGGLAVLVVALLLYLTFSDLSSWRDTVARVASNAMDRELTIAGEFEVDLGIVTRVRATELSLANTEWGSEPSMATIDRLDGEINLWELFSGSIHLPSVDIEGGRAIFESDAEAGSNWRLGKDDGTGDDSGDAGPVRLRIDRIRGRGVELIFGGSGGGDPVELIVDSVDSTGDPQGMHELTGGGSLRGADYTLSGRFGSFADLINLAPFDHDLRGNLGSTELRSAGTIGRIATLGDLDIEAEATIPNPTEIYRLIGLTYSFERPLEIKAKATTAAGMTDFTLTATGEAAELQSHGTIDSLISPEDLDLELKLKGPDIRPVAALAGISDLDKKPFNLEGRFTWRGFPVVVSDLEIRVGENWITADGRLGKPPLMLETDFRFEGAGPDVAEVASLAGLRLPHDMYEIDCHILRVEDGLVIEDVRAKIGPALLTTTGFVGDPPEYAKTDLAFEVQGPDLAHYRSLLGIDLPSVPFTIGGRLAPGDQSIALHGVKAKIGKGNIALDGRVTTVAGMIGTDLSFVTDGLDLLHIGDLLGFDGLPTSPFHAKGRVSVTREGYQLQDVTGRIADMELSARGLITRREHLVGTTLEIAAAGNDLSILDDLVPAVSLPSERFRVNGRIELRQHDVGLREVVFELGEASGNVDGRIGRNPTLDGTEIEVDARGSSLAVLDSLIPQMRLPAVEFSAVGGLTLREGAIGLRDVSVGLADNLLRINGSVLRTKGFVGSSFEASIEGPNLDSVRQLAEGSIGDELPGLPEQPFKIVGGVTIDEYGYHLSHLEASLGSANVSVTGVIGHWPDFVGSDIEVEAGGPDASLFATSTGVTIPVAPFQLTGRVGRQEWGIDFGGIQVRLGGYRVELDGSLGKLPKLIGTRITIKAEGPDLDLLREFVDIGSLPSEPFRLTGQFEGNSRRFKSNALDITFGASDVSGSFRVELEGKPRFSGRLQSGHVRVADLVPQSDENEIVSDNENSETATASSRFMVPDDPWDLAFLDRIDMDLDWDIDELEYLHNTDRDIELSVLLDNGRVQVDRLWGTGTHGGKLRGSASLIPVAEGHRLETEFHIDDGMLNLAGETADPSQYTPVDFHLDLSATGRTPHEMAASANGRVSVTAAEGILKKGIIDMVSADVLVTLLNALNPFAKDDTHTRLNCAVLVANFDDGLMTLKPAAIQTDKVTVLGDGIIDFNTEKLRLDWITKPRKGIGISASMFTNPYIRLGGTMSKPAIEMKPAEAIATTGVAVVTMGISLVAKGMLDRITAEKKVCERALKQLEEME